MDQTCSKHNEDKVLYGTQWKCRSCNREYQQKWFATNRATQRERVKRNNIKGAKRNRAYVWDLLRNSVCHDCGLVGSEDANWVVFEFDHRDRETKEALVSQLIYKPASLKTLKAEIEKCDVVCANCHRRRTMHQLGWAKGSLYGETAQYGLSRYG